MNLTTNTLTSLSLALLLATGCTPEPSTEATRSAPPISVLRTEDGYLLSEGRDSVLHYHDQPVLPEHEHARAHYVHPLFGVRGEVLTEDFPADHLHHHGLFWAWHQLFVGTRRIGDGWMQEGIAWDVRDVEVQEGESSSEIRTRVLWSSPRDDKGRSDPFVEESTTIRVFPASDFGEGPFREIDFTIELRALVDSVRIGGSEDEKGYGGFSARIRLPDDIRFVGPDGPVEPQVTAVDAGPWLDVSGTLEASPARESQATAQSNSGASTSNSPAMPSGVAILQHPSNPDFPQPWILRRQDSMQNVKWPGAKPVQLPRSEPVTLRYRVVVHEGSWDAASLERLYDRYTAPAE